LDPHTVNQIAAGEVVERPSSALKELIENSLDAGATRIVIELESSGIKRLEVRDDGWGMTEEGAFTALQRHATSKLSAIEDLNRVETMGFRGEALPAIASVSRMTLSTGATEGSRLEIILEGSQALDSRNVPGPKGTTVKVEDLFWNTPARLKFLKSASSELSLCIEVVSRAALARPDVRFLLRHEDSVMVQTSGSGDLVTAVAEVWGREAARALTPLDFFSGQVRVRGLVSPPHFTKPTRSHQWLYVNGRAIRSRALTAALDQACRSLTPEKRHILAVLTLDIDPAGVDVNVSPTKSEVKFHREGAVFDAVRRAVKEALLASGMVPDASDLAAANDALRQAGGLGAGAPAVGESRPLAGSSQPWTEGWFGGAPPLAAALSAQAPLDLDIDRIERGGPEGLDPRPGSRSASLPDLRAGLRVIGQVDATFILAENDAGLLIIDQHVAHERVIYERLVRTRGSGAVEKQPLLSPEALTLDRRTFEEVQPRLGELAEIGFDLEVFGSDTLLVRSVPALSRKSSPLLLLRDILDQLASGMGEGCLTPARDEVYILCSCKLAVKAGDPMGLADMERLIRDLAETENPYFCPHGRPITLVFPREDLRRRFKR
jgi:DNA mismatch repair protein MutL